MIAAVTSARPDLGNTIAAHNPASGEYIGAVPSFTLDQARESLWRAHEAQQRWAAQTHAERRDALLRFLDQLSAHGDALAELVSRETGKPVFEAQLFELIPLQHLVGHFARRAKKILKPRRIGISIFRHRSSMVHRVPRGVVLVISPWNFPLAIPIGEVVMALLAGNGVLLKPASLTPLTAVRVRELFDAAGFDPDLFQVITGPGSVASGLIASGGVDYVNFTGSTAVGRQVAALCGERLIPCSMELGGKDPALVLADADLDTAARSVVWGAFANSGQICASVERVYVDDRVHDAFVERVVSLTRSLRQGDPGLGEPIELGAMTDEQQIAVLERQVADAERDGARVLTGGARSIHGRSFFPPTVIDDATDEMDVMRDESFGPLLPIARFESEDEAIARANDSRYGLSAYVYSSNRERAERVASQLEAGTVVINDSLLTHAFPEAPWGGIKESGLGRVHSDEGLLALTEARHINRERVRIPNPAHFPYGRTKQRRLTAAGRLLFLK